MVNPINLTESVVDFKMTLKGKVHKKWDGHTGGRMGEWKPGSVVLPGLVKLIAVDTQM